MCWSRSGRSGCPAGLWRAGGSGGRGQEGGRCRLSGEVEIQFEDCLNLALKLKYTVKPETKSDCNHNHNNKGMKNS